MTKYYALIGPKLDGPALNSAMTACSIEPSIRQVPRLYVNRMVFVGQTDDDSNFADVTLVSDDVEIKNLTTLVKSLKVSSLEERKCPKVIFPVES